MPRNHMLRGMSTEELGLTRPEDDRDPANPGRRVFLSGSAAAAITLAARFVTGAGKESKPPTRVLDAPGIWHGKVAFRSGAEEIDGYLARPTKKGKSRPVLVIAGNRITEEYIPNTCAGLAVAGYVGLAPNIFHTVPDSAQTPDAIDKALEGRTEDDYLRDIRRGADYLASQAFVKTGGLGIIGFCSGGRRAMLFADRYKGIKAVVAYHPALLTMEEVAHLKAPVQIHLGTADRHIPVAGIRELEGILKKQSTPVELFLYEGADHGFLAYTRPYYRPDDAVLSWKRTLAFLDRHLGR
jgi:carboxymethylenebutenolidase